MISEPPRHCSLGVKKSSKAYQQYWRGYKSHLDVADVPLIAPGKQTVPIAHRTFQENLRRYNKRRAPVRGASKIMAHLMFGILALTVDQLLRFNG